MHGVCSTSTQCVDYLGFWSYHWCPGCDEIGKRIALNIEPTYLAFRASMLTITPLRFPDGPFIYMSTCICGVSANYCNIIYHILEIQTVILIACLD